eukprot:scaffold327_cov58-Phaeocystis_antarctica.AAC.5
MSSSQERRAAPSVLSRAGATVSRQLSAGLRRAAAPTSRHAAAALGRVRVRTGWQVAPRPTSVPPVAPASQAERTAPRRWRQAGRNLLPKRKASRLHSAHHRAEAVDEQQRVGLHPTLYSLGHRARAVLHAAQPFVHAWVGPHNETCYQLRTPQQPWQPQATSRPYETSCDTYAVHVEPGPPLVLPPLVLALHGNHGCRLAV